MKALVMKEAWEIAKRAARLHGGSAKEWIAFGLVRAWKKAKADKLVEIVKEEFKPILRGMMTEKQERFIASLIARGKYVANNPILQAFQISSLRSRITKQQASQLIGELLNA